MARLTGNYKRGNERQAKNHPRNARQHSNFAEVRRFTQENAWDRTWRQDGRSWAEICRIPTSSLGVWRRPNTRWSRQRLRRSLYRGLLVLTVYLFSEVVSPTRRCGSAFPLYWIIPHISTRSKWVNYWYFILDISYCLVIQYMPIE